MKFLSPILSLALISFGSTFFMSYITMLLDGASVSTVLIGYIHAAYYGGLLISALKIEPLLYRIGYIRCFVLCASILSASILLQALIQTPDFWILFRFCAGLAIGGLYISIEGWLVAGSDQSKIGRVLAIYMVTLYMAQAISQQFIGRLPMTTLLPYIFATFFTIIAIIPTSVTRTASPILPETEVNFNLLQYFYNSPLAFFGCFISGIIGSSFYSFAPKFAQASTVTVPMIMSLTILGGLVGQWPIGKISDFIDRRKLLLILSSTIIFPAILIAILSNNKIVVLSSSFCLGSLIFTIYPVSIALACDNDKANNTHRVIATMLFINSLGSFIGPLISSQFIVIFGSQGLYSLIALLSLVLSLIAIWTVIYQKPISLESQSEYVVVSTNPGSNLLDPRNNE